MTFRIAFKPGDKVVIAGPNMNGVVSKVIIERECVLYTVEWWEDKNRYSIDMYESELEKNPENINYEVEVF